MEKLNCEQAKRLDLVEYLAFLGHQPQKIRNEDYWYLSPLRMEKPPSFRVNRQLNVWYDHGIGKGGNLIDFGVLYFNCSVKYFLDTLQSNTQGISSSFHPQILNKIKSLHRKILRVKKRRMQREK